MNFDNALGIAEELIEEKTQCSIESIRDFGGRIKYFTDKFTTLNIFGERSMLKITKQVILKGAKENFASEKCIERDFKISKIKTDSDAKLQKEVCKAEALWAIIQYGIIPLENFWCMEHEEERGKSLTENETKILAYMRDMANLYLKETEKLTHYFTNLNNVGC